MHPYKIILLRALKNGRQTRSELVEITGIPRSTIYDHLDPLIKEHDLVKKIPIYAPGKKGHPFIYYEINGELIEDDVE